MFHKSDHSLSCQTHIILMLLNVNVLCYMEMFLNIHSITAESTVPFFLNLNISFSHLKVESFNIKALKLFHFIALRVLYMEN